MAHVTVMIPVDLDAPARDHRYLDGEGNPCAWLHFGAEGELSLYGTLDAMRRLGQAALAAAYGGDTGRIVRGAPRP